MYFEEKIEKILDEFKTLFIQMLQNKNYNTLPEPCFFANLISNVKYFYPNIQLMLDRLLYYYIEVEDSEEKLENLILLYSNIKEAVYGRN